MRSPSACCCRGPWPWSRHRKRPSRRPRRSRQPLSYLREQLSALPGQPSITIDPPRNERLTPCDVMSPFLPSGMKPRSRMTVGIRCTAPKAWTAYVQASVGVPGQYYVASRTIAAGQALTPADAGAARRRHGRPAPGAITDPDTVAGMTAAYRITAGQPIRAPPCATPSPWCAAATSGSTPSARVSWSAARPGAGQRRAGRHRAGADAQRAGGQRRGPQCRAG